MAQDLTKQNWDVIVIGTGMGGATLGYALAKAGRRVLFCEKGHSLLTDDALRGAYAELFFDRIEVPSSKHADLLSRSGRYVDAIENRVGKRSYRFVPHMGCGTGGSSSLYGMAMERFYPKDFTPRQNHPNAKDTSLPDAWPITYDDLRLYYLEAENLFRVRGGADPLRADQLDQLPEPPPISGPASELFDHFQQKGMHPYLLPMACERVPGCNVCQGYLCDKNCKNDAEKICLRPALQMHGAQLLDRCRVVRLEATPNRVTSIVCEREGQTLTLNSKLIVLAAGSLQTPSILLRSQSADWPEGLANRSGMVGRNLMRHMLDVYGVFVKTQDELGLGLKELALNDLYYTKTGIFGTVQSFGVLPDASLVVAEMEHTLQGTKPWLIPLFKLAKPVMKRFFATALSRSLLLAAFIEDLPYANNRVVPSNKGDDIVLEYQIHPQDMRRLRAHRKIMKDLLKPYRFILSKQAENNERIAHVCGTCRFGDDPQTSVLDANNKAHGLENLYVVDASFFPSSGGVNPSLTIAANALRIAEWIKKNT